MPGAAGLKLQQTLNNEWDIILDKSDDDEVFIPDNDVKHTSYSLSYHSRESGIVNNPERLKSYTLVQKHIAKEKSVFYQDEYQSKEIKFQKIKFSL